MATRKAPAFPRVTILQAMNSPKLFGPEFPSPDWDSWRVCLAALFGLPLTPAQLELYQQCTGRQTAPTARYREAVLVVGRRGGKSRILALLAVYLACFVDQKPYLAAGEVGTIAIICPSRRQAANCLRYVIGLLEMVPALKALIETATTESVGLSCRVQIEVHTASFRVTRGFTLLAVLADESAYWPSEDSATPDVEIIRALRPSLLTIPTGMLVLASSPYAQRGVLWNYYSRYFGKEDAPVFVWHAGTTMMHPSVDVAQIEAERELDPGYVQGEYDAIFRTNVGALLDETLIRSAVDPGVTARPPRRNISYRMRVDGSGGKHDSFAACVYHLEGDTVVIDLLYEARPPFNAMSVVKEICDLARQYRVAQVSGDGYAAEILAGAFRNEGIAYRTERLDRSAVYLESVALWTSGRIRMLDAPRAVHQLSGLERKPTASGRDKVYHPREGHDDLALAICGGAVDAAVDTRGELLPVARLLSDGRGTELPKCCDRLFCVACEVAGRFGVVWFARNQWADSAREMARLQGREMSAASLIAADFDLRAAEGGHYLATYRRLVELADQCPARSVSRLYVLPEHCVAARAEIEREILPRYRAGASVMDIEVLPLMKEVVRQPERIAELARGPCDGGVVRWSVAVLEKNTRGPLAGELSWRYGEKVEGVLGLAWVCGVAMTFERERTLRGQ
jgi:hypothetical protein